MEPRTENNKQLIEFSLKQVRVRTPRRGRSKNIVVPGTKGAVRNFPVSRLNNYSKTMKRHKGPLSLASDLESIEENGDDDFNDASEP